MRFGQFNGQSSSLNFDESQIGKKVGKRKKGKKEQLKKVKMQDISGTH